MHQEEVDYETTVYPVTAFRVSDIGDRRVEDPV